MLGKLAAVLAPPEPQLQHAALRLTARGWETLPLPAPDGSGSLGLALDLHAHEAVEARSDGRRHIPLTPDRAVGDVTGDVLAALGELVGPCVDPAVGGALERAARPGRRTRNLRPRAGRCPTSPPRPAPPWSWRSSGALSRAQDAGNAWWGSFDLAVRLFSGRPAEPPSDDFIPRNSSDAAGGRGRLVAR